MISATVLIVHYNVKDSISTSCDYFNKGFKQTKIQKGGSCNIPIPKTCFLFYTSNLWDVSRIRGINCKNDRNSDEFKLLKQWSNKENATRLGFPRTQNWEFFPDSILANFNKNIFKNMVNMDLDKDKAKDVEVFVDFSNYYPEVKIEL